MYSPTPLHIPDGFLSILISLLFWVLTILIVGYAIRRSQVEINESQVPLMGVMAAFIFTAQMINFPVAGGTSGHLLGGTLAAITLGPWAGILVMTSVIALQALLFQDGGLLVMGANIFNMGILTSLVGFGLFNLAVNRGRKFKLGIAGIAAFLGVLSAAFFTGIQLWMSGTSPARIVFPAMISIHSLIGLGEALITMAALSFIFKVRPTLITKESFEPNGSRGLTIIGVMIAISTILLSPYASTNPDGLERVAENLGFLELSQTPLYEILPKYIIPSLGDGQSSTILAGLIGLAVIGAGTLLIVYFFKKQRRL